MPSLYVHVPFCVQKCSYCAFYSHSLRDLLNRDVNSAKAVTGSYIKAYLESLAQEINIKRKDAPQGVSSLFIGGGTPTALDEEDLARLLILINNNFVFLPAAERTVEGNPGTLTPQKLRVLREQGINRFSLGVQAFDDQLLERISRIHSAKQAGESIRLIRETGFTNLNLDLMFGLPGQSITAWEESLKEALEYRPEHLSIYGLMLEENTPLTQNDELLAILPDDDLQAEMYAYAVETLQAEGYSHYETSNFALPGYECQHNLGYWHGREYLGLGPGAVSYLKGVRWQNRADLEEYAQLSKSNDISGIIEESEYEVLTAKEKMAERIMLGLRLEQGLDLEAFQHEFGVEIRDIYNDVLERYMNQRVLCIEEGFLKLDQKYWFVANAILREFI